MGQIKRFPLAAEAKLAPITIGIPGAEGGPCRAPCRHRRCAAARRMATWLCQYCHQRLGFGARITRNPAAHLSCARLAAIRRNSGAELDTDYAPFNGAHSVASPAWEAFRKDRSLREAHAITAQEMEMLSHVALLGDAQSPNDFVYILKTLRAVLKPSGPDSPAR